MKAVDDDVVPDSEEERRLEEDEVTSSLFTRPAVVTAVDIIEISSDESDALLATPKRRTRDKQATRAGSKHVGTRIVILSSSSETETSDSDDGNRKSLSDVIDLDDSSPVILPTDDPSVSNLSSSGQPQRYPFQSLFADDEDDSDTNDDSVLTLEEPKSAHRPIKRGATPNEKKQFPATNSNLESPTSFLLSRITPSFPSSTPPSTPGTGRIFGKAVVAAEQRKREEYAEKLFAELNESVFKGGLPTDTKLTWNPRLLCTAGRAKWHRNREGVETSEIELATKILDCDERIRNTLSHEMCHLASWTINKNPKEAHGRIWKTWAANVMRKRPDISISTKHNYEIVYPYEWRCEECSKVYGRFSKSIKPDECVCGACRVGKLVPLFTTRVPKTPKTNTKSRMAPQKNRDSPLPVLNLTSLSLSPAKTDHRDSEDSEVEVLISEITAFKL